MSIDPEQLKKAKERAKKRSEEIFKPAPEEIEEEFRKETVMGNPENLIRPDNEEE